MENNINQADKNLPPIKERVKEQTVGYIMAGLGFVAGLAWNEAIKALIDTFFIVGKDSLFAKFTYALIVTLIVVIISINFTRLGITNEKK